MAPGHPREDVAFQNDLLALVRTQALQPFCQERTVAALCRLASAVYAAMALYGDHLDRRFPNRRSLACQTGCWTCCDSLVVTWPIYSIFAALQARSTLPAADFAALRARILAGPTPCPLLVDGVCTIYPARPPVCRHYYSYSSALCRAKQFCQDDPAFPRDQAIMAARAGVTASLVRMVHHDLIGIGLVDKEQWLGATLRVMIAAPDTIERWLAGDDVFREATRSHGAGTTPNG